MVATLEFVMSLRGPETRKGILVTTHCPLSICRIKTLWKLPSIFSLLTISAAPGHAFIAFLHSAGNSVATVNNRVFENWAKTNANNYIKS
jgi:hypothetical protein